MKKHLFARQLTGAVALALMSAPIAASGNEISAEVIEEDDGTRTLVHEAVIDAPVEAVWATLSTEEGWKHWGPRFAKFDLRHGGTIESGYHDGASAGDPRNIRHRILAFVPERMLAIQVEHAPAGGPADSEAVKQVWGVYELEPVGSGKTRLTISGVGYGSDEASSSILEFFRTGNIWSIDQMRKKLEAVGTVQSESPASYVHRIEIPASRQAIWDALTTPEGLKWIAPEAHVELEVGGAYELYFRPDNPEDRGMEGTRVLSFVPGRMLTTSGEIPGTWTVWEILERGEKSEVTVTLSGSGSQWTERAPYFDREMPGVLERLSVFVTGNGGATSSAAGTKGE